MVYKKSVRDMDINGSDKTRIVEENMEIIRKIREEVKELDKRSIETHRKISLLL